MNKIIRMTGYTVFILTAYITGYWLGPLLFIAVLASVDALNHIAFIVTGG